MAARFTWIVVAIGAASAAGAVAFAALGGHLGEVGSNLLVWASYSATGALSLWLRPQNRAARRLAIAGSSIGITVGIGAGMALLADGHVLGAWGWAGLVAFESANWLSFVASVALFAVFPDGQYQRRYERRLVSVFGLSLVPLLLIWLVASPHLADTNVVWASITVASPIAIRSLSPLAAAGAIVEVPTPMMLVALLLVLLRYRRSGSEERLRIRWPLYAVALTACFFAFQFALPPGWGLPGWAQAVIFSGVALALPLALVIGIVRHRLLDVDLVIRRSLVYAALWAVIAAIYTGLAAALGIAAGQRVPLGLAVALTILATLVFQPARRRLEVLADRLVYGRRLTGYELIGQLGGRLASSPGAEDVATTVAAVVHGGLATRWVRVTAGRPEPKPVAAVGIDPADPAAAKLTAPLVHRGETIGAIECGPRLEGRYSRTDEELLATLGRQAALAIRNSQLASELSNRLEELAASRARLVEAEEAGRRRLERDLHDGVQQEMVGVLARLGLARNQLRRDSESAEATIREAQIDARRALESLQELARGIHPAILTDRGLIEALEERATRMTIPVQVTTDGIPRDARFAAQIEGGAYFFVSEALANVLKHAGATHVYVRLRCVPGGQLLVEVDDDGQGFDPARSNLSGLRGLADRIEALGGRMEVSASRPQGALVCAWLPVAERALV